MITKIFSHSVKALSNPEIFKHQSKDELKAVYILLQVFRILVTLIFIFSIIEPIFIGALLEPGRSLMEWSLHHKYLISIFSLIFFYLPVNLIFWVSLNMGSITHAWQKDQSFKIFSPENFTVLIILLLFLVVPISAFIAML